MSAQTQDRVVICMKWGTLYPGSYVNVLYRAVCKHLAPPFRFVCLTNEPEGLDPNIEHFPLPDLDLPPERYGAGAWPKLGMFKEDLYGLTGRALFIDLDSVIIGRLEPFFEMEGQFISIAGGPGWRRGSENPTPRLASGVFAFDLGSQPQVLENFLKDKEAAYAQFQNEQQVIEHYVHGWKTWPKPWVISFKKHLRQPLIVDRFKAPRDPDPGTLIVAFHGDPRPIEVIGRNDKPWGKFPHYGRKPIPWVRDYWIEHGFEMEA
ncbi:hypothetical protein [Pseudoruegeria sp. SHC-113]|uniref:hypothetical protein n=1 Tax=Pseudoruegeria sp. SHC-113 TaxID=2855439 RepID=UPI0021BAD24C|nr:hypothetical protein [Pseudoruegeria sp. SHC-113]MCT8160372.1 hypothetical protein [Pseudoruegeria sp. SHC-113]